MKNIYKINRLSLFVVLASWQVAGYAGGFAIGTQSGSGTGNAFAGGAAVADDASVVWSNPAGMTALPMGKHVTGAVHALLPSFKFNNAGSSGAVSCVSPPFPACPGGEGGDGGGLAFVPNGFFAMDITPALRFGVALNAPFGLKTEYNLGWRGQATALVSGIKSINVQPSLAYQVNNFFSIGGGISVQKLDAKLSGFAGAPGVLELKADDLAFGFNLGVTFQPSSSTRIGAHYRSSIKYNLDGTATFSAAPIVNGPVRADLKVPDSLSLSLTHQATPNLELMGDATWTGWDSVQQLVVIRNAAVPGAAAGSTLTTLPFLWKDTWRLGVGANYRVSAQMKLRFGVAHDQSPTNDLTRTPRLPDESRTWLAFGLQYKPTKQGALELAYAHEFVKNASINAPIAVPPPTPATNLIGSFKNKADIISVQYSHAF